MHFHTPPPWKLLLCALLLSQAKGQQASYKALLENTGDRLSDTDRRATLVADLRSLSTTRREDARTRATASGIPLGWTTPGNRKASLIRFDGDKPRYLVTHNANAAISTGANLLQAAPYSVTGSGIIIGLWDGGTAYSSHQELIGRVSLKDPISSDDHATHVAGTLAASGVKAAAKGMAPIARIDSYDWDDDVAELTDRAATYPGESGKIYISNHSYGLISGWENLGGYWVWYGSGVTSTSVDGDFGRYSDDSAADDALAYKAPYFLMFRSAGNDRNDNPAAGDSVYLSFQSPSSVPYNPSIHPRGDGVYHGGYENISADALAKNLMTIGAVDDAVTNGKRDASKAAMSSFSSWGPTDDGRIKPDVVANGVDVYSSVATSSTSYDTYSGTSMASPNAAGSSALLVQYYNKLFPGQYMRASTLKGLIIHTCTDLGTPGPDYQYGWGLVDVKSAADLITDYSVNPGKSQISESQLNSTFLSRTQTLTWDGVSPIRATLSWTDPAGDSTTTTDSRVPRLVNDLNLKIIGPDGTTYLPWVMPFVGTWTPESMALPAVTGVNHTDNVEQVYIPAPSLAGDYQVVVDYSGGLRNGSQTYSLILSGAAEKTLPGPALTSYTPQTITGSSGDQFTATGSGFQTGALVYFVKNGSTTQVPVGGLQITPETITGRLNTLALTSGSWTLTIRNPDGQEVSPQTPLTVDGTLWSETFENTTSGWTYSSTNVQNTWAITTEISHSATHSYRGGTGPNKTSASLVSPGIPVAVNAANLTFSFWQSLSFMNGDGGVLEVSSDNGTTWSDVTAATSGTAFVSGGYNGTVLSNNQLGARPAWTGSNGGFAQVVLSVDSAKFAGKNLKLRWRAGSNDDGVASTNAWAIDDLALNGKLVTVSFDSWAASQFPDLTDFNASETGDFDGDGLTNFVEFMMGTDPKSPNPPLSVVANADGSMTMTFTQIINAEGVTPHAETSTDLVNWTDVPITTVSTSATSPLIQNRKATLPGGSTAKYIRLRFAR